MTNKAYIVANEQQEREVLEKLESQDIIWKYSLSHKTTQFTPSRYHNIVTFPYILKVIGSTVSYGRVGELDEYEVVYDGRKEEYMSEKYVVSQKFIDELNEWKAGLKIEGQYHIDDRDLFDMPVIIDDWWLNINTSALEQNNRLIAIIRWVNGEDVFKIEKPKKWVVRSKVIDTEGSHLYINVHTTLGIPDIMTLFGLNNATKFDTKEEAESWANSHQEVRELIEVKE